MCVPLATRAQAPADKESSKTEDKNVATKSAGNAPAAESAQAASRDQRLQKIEEQLRALLEEVEKLRKISGSDPVAQTSPAITLDSKWTQALTWRSIGPAGMGGRIVDFAVVDSDPNTYWVATASGGLLKTTNNGTTFVHQFDHEATVSIGCVSVAPSDPNIVWAGTGENNPRNSVSYGDGVYKSTDGGKTWKNMGLGKSFQIGRIAIHRTNPDIVYVGALGRLYGPNEERGLYKTTDGGKTWERVLYVDDKTGVIDMRMHPTDSDTLLVAMWERQRDGYDSHPGGGMEDGFDSYDPIKKWGAGAGIYKTTDGGKNWHKLTKGLPTNNMGRIGLDYYRKDPNTVFAIIERYAIQCQPRRTGLLFAAHSAAGQATLEARTKFWQDRHGDTPEDRRQYLHRRLRRGCRRGIAAGQGSRRRAVGEGRAYRRRYRPVDRRPGDCRQRAALRRHSGPQGRR